MGDLISEIMIFGKENKDALIAYGVIVAATITASGAVYSARLQNKNARKQRELDRENASAQRIADHRVRWIENLRALLAKYLADVTRLSEIEINEPESCQEEQAVLYPRILETRLTILLSLNAEEVPHKKLIDGLEEIYSSSAKWACATKGTEQEKETFTNFKQAKENILATAGVIFKTEWVKVKQGC